MIRIAAGLCVVMVCSSSAICAQSTQRVSIDSSGAQGTGASGTFRSSISADGRYVAFASDAPDLVAGDTNGTRDVFVHDRLTGVTELVSISTSGVQGGAISDDPGLSSDGRFVAFASVATNLVTGDTNAVSDVFVRDRLLGITERISVDSNGAQGNGTSHAPSISADGRFVAFASGATNLITGDTNGRADCFVHDRQLGTTVRVSVGMGGIQGNASSDEPAISADGRFVSFDTEASNFVAGDMNGEDIFVRDLLTATTEQVNVSTGGLPANGISGQSSISADGRFIAFFSVATNLVAGHTLGLGDVYVRDRLAATTESVCLDSSGGQANGGAIFASISGDGRFVSFMSLATDLIPNDANGARDIFVRDRQSGTTERVSVATSGTEADLDSMMDVISADGRYVAFSSDATNLVSGDTNAAGDVFVHDRGSATPATPFCFGDGTASACPCGPGAAGNGCPNSVFATGGNLAMTGTASLTADTLVLGGSSMPNASALYFQGTTQANGGLGVVFGDGLRCAGGTNIRLATKTNVAGSSAYPTAGDPTVSVRGLVTAPGLRTYQVWYRNAASFCTSDTFNLTNGCQVSWVL